jgi:ankyrin repeat protein
MKLLLAYGADPKIATAHNDSALTAAAGIGWVEGVPTSIRPGETSRRWLLLELGLDPNGANKDGRTPLIGVMKGATQSSRCSWTRARS